MNKYFKRLTAALTGLVTVFAGASGVVPSRNSADTAAAAGGLLAFPGAVGGGKYATGGRGGEIYHVTNLNDSGTGSLRDAVSKSNRIVVFDVSGTIELKSNIVCQSNITVAGQTAPGGSGVTLKNYKWGMGGDNIIVRYISSRPGPYNATSSGNDAWGGAAGSNSIIDHCSIGWSSDEQWGLYSKNDNYTLQYSVIGPANSWGGHAKGVHGFGIMFGRANFSFDHNLIIHNVSRNFRGKVTDQNAADFTNNIIYDWGYQTTYGTIGHVNYVNNTLKAGNSTASGYHYAQVSANDNFKLYLTGNRILNKDNSVRNDENSNWSALSFNTGKERSNTESTSHFPITVNGEDVSTVLTAESAAASYDNVINYAGNGISPAKRTAIDQQCAEETKNGTGSCSGTAAYDSSVSDLDKYKITCGVTYSYPSAVTKKEITDADNDGMDDNWELARGLDPSDPTDYKGDYCGQGYMNIEYYINDLTVDSFPPGTVELSPENAVDPISAFETIEAEDHALQEGIRVEDTAAGGQNIGFIENGDWIMFRKVDFDNGAKSFKANISGNAAGIEIYLDNMSGTPAAKISFAGTSGFSDYQELEYNIPAITGVHNLYLKFTGGEGYLLNMDRFVFGREAIPLTGKLITDVSVNDSANPVYWTIGYDAAAGSLIFGDRTFTITELPAALSGAEQLMTSCDAKGTTGDTATFTAGADIDVYAAFDSRVTAAPDWLSGYEKSDLTFTTSNDLTFVLYKKSVKAGEKVTLGSNGQSAGCVNFTVLAVPAGNEPQVTTTAETTTVTTTETTTTTAAETTAATTEQPQETTETATTVPATEPQETTAVPATEYGDSNEDGKVNMADAVAVLQYLANSTKYSLSDQGVINSDCDGSAGLTGSDAITILRVEAGEIAKEDLPLGK
ncbi:MAG: carbohydrate-binding protein [Ruminococcus sp.]|nr:carbohydrate-binding protein [Ruminococcus sp.]